MKYITPSSARARNAATEDRPLHVAMVGQRGIPAEYGGIERVVEELAVRMVQQGHRVTVFCFERPLEERSGKDQPTSYRGVDLVYLPTARGKHSEMLFHAFRSTLAAIRLRPDILHYHAVGPSLFSMLARIFSGARVVCTIHGRDDQQSKWSPRARMLLRFSARIASRVPHTTTVVARHLVNSIEEDFGRRPTYVTNGVTALVPASPGSVLDELDLEPGRYFVQVARPIPDKASDVMFEAAALASHSMPVVLVGELGDDPYSDRVRAEVAIEPQRPSCRGRGSGPSRKSCFPTRPCSSNRRFWKVCRWPYWKASRTACLSSALTSPPTGRWLAMVRSQP